VTVLGRQAITMSLVLGLIVIVSVIQVGCQGARARAQKSNWKHPYWVDVIYGSILSLYLGLLSSDVRSLDAAATVTVVLDSVSRCITSLLPLCCSTGDHFSGTHAVAITFNGVDAVSMDIPSNDAVSMDMNISDICHWTTGQK
jgi:hypothetical protein